MDYKNNSNTGLIIVADCMLLSVEYIGNVHQFFNNREARVAASGVSTTLDNCWLLKYSIMVITYNRVWINREKLPILLVVS